MVKIILDAAKSINACGKKSGNTGEVIHIKVGNKVWDNLMIYEKSLSDFRKADEDFGYIRRFSTIRDSSLMNNVIAIGEFPHLTTIVCQDL